MKRKAEIKMIRAALKRVNIEISHKATSRMGHCPGPNYAGALASEGYAGGYRDALMDVLLLIESKFVPQRRNYWDEEDRT